MRRAFGILFSAIIMATDEINKLDIEWIKQIKELLSYLPQSNRAEVPVKETKDSADRVDEKLKTSFIRKNGVYKGGLIDPSSKDFTSDANLFNFQAKIIKELADKEPAVIVGRCADFVLSGRKDVIKLFIYCDEQTAIRNVIDAYGGSEKDASKLIEKTNKDRCAYYKHYTGRNWEDARNYNICLDTSSMDYQTCVDIIKGYISIIDKK